MQNFNASTSPVLQIEGFSFKALFQPEALEQLDSAFLDHLRTQELFLFEDLQAYRLKTKPFHPEALSQLLIDCARHLEVFVARLFSIEQAVEESQLRLLAQNPIFIFKQWYVLREAKRKLSKAGDFENFSTLTEWLYDKLAAYELDHDIDLELAVAKLGELLLQDEQRHLEKDRLVAWCVKALTDPAGQQFTRHWVSFHLPGKIDHQQLVPLYPVNEDALNRFEGDPSDFRPRDGFKLTDTRMNQREVLGEVHYCVYCHKNDGDFCSKGFPVKKGEPHLGLKTNPLQEILTGCPLEEKISEMHVLKRDGYNIGALAMIMVDNPMCPITGHRICNDCMKACIYQKQDPVNIPQTETGILTDVLALPWGVEIYDLFTRWNPLRDTQWVIKPYNGLKALIMGMGPAGFTLAHHLTMEGFAVVGTDGLKIEPLPQHLLEQPIFSYEDLKESLDTRILAGFGGVAEYGITVRWDKNFLKLIYLSLLRRPHFQVFGGIRFGGTLTVEDAWALGFDHLAIAVGAGLPKELSIPGSLAPGMRQANDFLMALQLTGAAKKSSLANLQIRLPALVIGGGLTGVDTATEIQAYYIAQAEKTLERYEILIAHFGEEVVQQQFMGHTREVLDEFLHHGRLVRQERQLAASQHRQPDFISLIRKWGGVTIVYRRTLQESPAYTRNHEEVKKALEEGIYYLENLEPVAAQLDEAGQVISLVCRQQSSVQTEDEKIIPARSIFVATGARPNIAYEFEHRGTFHREGPVYQTYQEKAGDLQVIFANGSCKTPEFGPFTSYHLNHHRISFLGDTHPIFHGSVVKAVASAKRTYPKILDQLGESVSAIGSHQEYQEFKTKMSHLFNARIVGLKRLGADMLELQVKAPMAAKNFKPGNFFRLQNFESFATWVGSTCLLAEGVAILGATVDKEKEILTFLLLEKGASSRLFATFKVGDPIAVMGPTGAKTKIPQDNEVVLLMGGRLASAYVRAMGPALREAGNQVVFLGIFENREQVFWQRELENSTDSIIWITRKGNPIATNRQDDYAATGELIEVLTDLAKVAQHAVVTRLQFVDRVHAVGSHRFINFFQSIRQQLSKEIFTKTPLCIASIYGPMQCMLKGVCAQCLQWQIDPTTGERTKAVFACSWQDQPLDIVDLDNLADRLSQNQMQETLTNLWLDYLLSHHEVQRI